MHLTTFHNTDKPLSAKPLFDVSEGKVVAIHLKQNGELKEHVTKVPALLLCVKGKVIYEDEKKEKITLRSGDYFHIDVNVKHWLIAREDSEAVLIK